MAVAAVAMATTAAVRLRRFICDQLLFFFA
jgi:hypothetical protein